MATLLKNTAPVFAKHTTTSPKLIQHRAGDARRHQTPRDTSWLHKSVNRLAQASVYHFVKDLDASSGGLSRSVPQICRELASQGVDISIITRNSPSPLIIDEPKCYIMGTNACNADIYLNEHISASHNTIIHTNGLWLPFLNAGPRFAQKFGLPYLISPRGMTAPWAMRHKRLKKAVAWQLYQRRMLQNASCIHATAGNEMQQVRNLGITAPIAVIPNGVEIPSEAELQTLQKESKKKAHPEIRTLLFLGRIQKVKGIDNLIKAWAKVRQPGWRIQIVGPEEDNHKAELQKLADRLGIRQDITFCEPQSNERKWKTYLEADLFVLPTHTENFGLTIAEALGCGTPVITTKGAPWKDIETHRCGWWTDIGADPLAVALQEAMSLTDQERSQLGERGRKLIVEKYSWVRFAQQLNDVYSWLRNEQPEPSCIQRVA
ncbi:glycosyltransferase [Cerasicoccus maritimus]|uniref:glycosyltransferase n=1 Tax=Cerasicoccus maritimus TaxID=490089 RepID=UPI002852D8A1|nr:glycosyltransferase [Cerasicoccus maritimus]